MEAVMGLTRQWTKRAVWAAALIGLSPVSEVYAQQTGKVWRVGLCHVGLDHDPPSLPTLKEELVRLGYTDGKNLAFDWRNQASEETADAQIRGWVAQNYDLIVAFEDQCVRAAKAATSTIPIVFAHTSDPVEAGYIKSLSNPGGNLTGPVTNPTLIGKRLELLKRFDPQLRRVLVLTDHHDAFSPTQVEIARKTAAAIGVDIVERDTPTAVELEHAFAELKAGEVGGVITASNYVTTNLRTPILAQAERARLPVATHNKAWIKLGALLSYGPDLAAAGPVAAHYIDKILKGAKPSGLPAEEISKVILAINLQTAQRLSLTVPPDILVQADEVIE
jgi:putative tryptophan/tyrosine transport system substrate-binding protein